MKGTKDFPQCGFSNTVVQILRSLNASFETINILDNDMLRQGLKEYSSWPTFPQLYIDGEFFGGCDITVGMSFLRFWFWYLLRLWFCLVDNVNIFKLFFWCLFKCTFGITMGLPESWLVAVIFQKLHFVPDWFSDKSPPRHDCSFPTLKIPKLQIVDLKIHVLSVTEWIYSIPNTLCSFCKIKAAHRDSGEQWTHCDTKHDLIWFDLVHWWNHLTIS